MKVGYLGPKGTFSYEVCKNYIKDNMQMVEYQTIPDTITALADGEIDEAIVPIENSLQGCVTDAIDTLIKNENIKVKDEILIDIKQNLMCNKKCNLNEIEKVYSHPQALSQCKEYLYKNNLLSKVVSVDSTALAAKKVSESNQVCGCICNISCQEEYDLELLEEAIQDNNFNQTKFWILSQFENNILPKDKMSMLFSVKDQPGALYKVLEIFNRYNLNLTKIESRPAKTVFGEYIFWIDVIITNSNEEKAIEEIKKMGIYTRILGKY